MSQLLIHLPDPLLSRFRSLIPQKERSRYIAQILAIELSKKDNELLASAINLERDADINALIDDFNAVVDDAIDEK